MTITPAEVMSRLPLVMDVLVPAIGALSDLTRNVISGARSFTTASAELRGIAATMLDRLDAAELADQERDKRNDDRLKGG